MAIDNVSSNSVGHCPHFAHCDLDRSNVVGMRGKVVEKGERNLPSRLAHTKNDKDIIAARELDLGSFKSSMCVQPVPFDYC